MRDRDTLDRYGDPLGCIGCLVPVLLGALGLGIGLAYLWTIWRRR